MTQEALYDRDCYARANKQAALLRAGKIGTRVEGREGRCAASEGERLRFVEKNERRRAETAAHLSPIRR
ncbi:hypothetical protein WOC76_20435 [Methylocystis sp. IM3]|jgi:hypothetical protein|uniref:hypothetical protein n=1 Tax=unclassified Methylocystis TaxID=2625913 RepID=UPI0030F7D42B